MILTDNQVLKWIKKVDNPELELDIESYPEEERDNRTDLQFLYEEVGYFMDSYYNEDTPNHQKLKDARNILRKTHYGDEMPCTLTANWDLIPLYDKDDIQWAKNEVNKYDRLKRLQKKLEKIGYEF